IDEAGHVGRPRVATVAVRSDAGGGLLHRSCPDLVEARAAKERDGVAGPQEPGCACAGSNGATAGPPQLPQIAAWNSLGPPTVLARLAIALHDRHRCGSLSRPLLEKNACSPAAHADFCV